MKKIFKKVTALSLVVGLIGGLEISELMAAEESAEAYHHSDSDDVLSGHQRHPEHDLKGLRISGDFTGIVQGVKNSEKGSLNKGKFSYSSDLFLEFPIVDKKDSFVSFHLDMGQGKGVNDLVTPSFSGPNADFEFDEENVKIVEAYYEKKISDMTLTFGKLNPTAYFDTNLLANNETFQFMAAQFGNNITIGFPGYVLGARATYEPIELIDISLGVFDNSFTIAELNIEPLVLGKQGNYRLTIWRSNVTVAEIKDATKTSNNQGFGLSFDQCLTDKIAAFLRYGVQNQKVSQFGSTFSLGLQVNGSAFGREKDELAFAFGQIQLGSDYKETLSESAGENQIEVYYRLRVNDAFSLTPDFQWLNNPSGDSTKKSYIVYGLRSQVNF